MIHTPEPWEVTDLRYIRQSNEPRHVVARASKMDGMEANARRIVACINACAGISTEQLECPGGNVAKVAGRLMKQRDALLAALEACLYMVGDPDNIAYIHNAIAAAKAHE